MSLTVRETFEQYSELSPEDKDLARRIVAFEQYFLNKNSNHTEFFGGNLLGTPAIRWSPQDTKRWLEEVLLIEDIRSCQEDLYECEGINKQFKVTSNIFNLSIPWVMNILWRQDKDIEKYRPGMQSALVVGMCYHLSTFMFIRFRYPANPEIAQSMYEKLDLKSDLKRYGSWIKLLRERTDIFMNTKGKYPDVWQEMVNDERTAIMCKEVNGNVRTTVNILTEKYYLEKEANERIQKVSKLGEVEGEQVIKDYIRKADNFTRDIVAMAEEPGSLIKDEILNITYDLAKNADQEMGRHTLYYLSDNLNSKDNWKVILERFGVYLLELSRTKKVDFNVIGEVTNHVASIFRSSSTKNKDVLFIKKEMHLLSRKANPGNRDAKHASNVGALITYLTIRIMAISYYK